MSGDVEELALWVAAYREQSLSPPQREALRQRLQSDRDFSTAFSQALIDATSLDVHFSAKALDHHQACIANAIHLDRTSQRLREVQKISEAYRRRRPRRSRQPKPRAPIAMVVTGCVLAAVALLAVWFLLPVQDSMPAPTESSAGVDKWSVATVHPGTQGAILAGHLLATGQMPPLAGALEVEHHADLSLKDGTRFQVSGPSRMRIGVERGAGPMHLLTGQLSIQVAPQSAGDVFAITVPHGAVQVVGTAFSMRADVDHTLVMLAEGTIDTVIGDERRRWHAPAAVQMDAGGAQSVSAIRIRAGDGRITDASWRLATDPSARNRQAWVLEPQSETLWKDKEASLRQLGTGKGVDIQFPALADTSYQVWVRARCDVDADAQHPLRHDTIAVEFLTGVVQSRPQTPAGRTFPEGPTLASFSGAALSTEYVWIGGWADAGLERQEEAVTVRFTDNGLQRIRIVAYEGPLRIEEIRLLTKGTPPPQ